MRASLIYGKRRSFELYRSSLNGVSIVTYDELFTQAKDNSGSATRRRTLTSCKRRDVTYAPALKPDCRPPAGAAVEPLIVGSWETDGC